MKHATTKPRPSTSLRLAGALALMVTAAQAQPARIEVHAGQTVHRVSRFLTGACIEDVNHEIYGGLYSQMIFGESFQEPPPALPPEGFNAYGGRWLTRDGELQADAGKGPKLVCNGPAFTTGEAGVEVLFPQKTSGNAGLIARVSNPGLGADNFVGYEISLSPAGQVVLGWHRNNFERLREAACDVPIKQWLALVVRMTNASVEVLVNGKTLIQYQEAQPAPAGGSIGLRTWEQPAQFRNLWVSAAGPRHQVAFAPAEKRWGDGVSEMWQPLRRASAQGEFALESQTPYAGRQSQRMTFLAGEGELGLENQGLNRWGLNLVAGKPYEGYLWARAEKHTDVYAALESRDGVTVYAEKRLAVASNGWQRLEFNLTPAASDQAGRFALKLKQPGSVVFGHAFLQPGEWGRFRGLPDRKDVAEALIDQGITVLRYGGSMVNAPEYRWKTMIGPRDHRPPYHGTWYAHSSNGWGILDFLSFCEAAGFLAIPDFNLDESPQDIADFMEYVNGSATSEWGRKRVADGHPSPYHLRHLELGNEERIDDGYWRKFQPLAENIWAKDPDLTIVVGDFAYNRRITDPFHFSGAASGISTLGAHQKILQLAKQHNRGVWFDVHVGTEGPKPDSALAGTLSLIDALAGLADGARHKVVVFEFNANNHSQRRALANALAINALERDGRLPVALSANCLQPDGQNDNGWNQGLLFLNPAQVWLQPPGCVTRMVARNYQPLQVKTEVQGPADGLDVSAQRSEDGSTLVLQVVNVGGQATPATIHLESFVPSRPFANTEELAGPMDAVNTSEAPSRIKPRLAQWRHELNRGETSYTFPAYSITVLRLE